MNNDFRERTQFLGKWIGVLFWLTILTIPLNFYLKYMNASDFGMDIDAANIVGTIFSFVYYAIELKLSREGKRYRDAALTGLVAIVLSIFVVVMAVAGVSAVAGSTILGLSVALFSVASEYQEFMAHAEALEQVAGEQVLSKKWRKLWIACVWFWIISIFSLLILAMVGFIGLIVSAIGVIGVLVVNIMKLVYLYQTSKLFKTIEEPFPAVEEDSEKAKGDSVEILLDPRIEAQVKAEEFMEDAETVVDADVLEEEN